MSARHLFLMELTKLERLGDRMFVTTAGRTNDLMIERAQEVAEDLGIEYITRNKRSILSLQKMLHDACIVVGKDRLELYPFGEEEPFFFHPNSSMFRIKRLLIGDSDPFVEACQLREGSYFLDCTLGLASDSIVASHIVGKEGRVVGIEGNPYLAYLTMEGLKSWKTDVDELALAFNRIEIFQQLAIDYLRTLPSKSFDVVYFDPMFDEHIMESDGIRGLSSIALYEDVSDEMIAESKRVARERVVLKDHFRSRRFEKFGFHVQKRKSAKFHFGVIEIQ
ncbi:hypothetical protein J2S07_001432 [Robertmurraya andreesenii]|uniref:SAM-dependent methyltransferase n=2 Tax=Anoxybacillus andreesenii TaxID=1325932 RepID=A0ABT9V2F0_9BACL|nr:hypothetical protein [Robertmurraya andreesenii]